MQYESIFQNMDARSYVIITNYCIFCYCCIVYYINSHKNREYLKVKSNLKHSLFNIYCKIIFQSLRPS